MSSHPHPIRLHNKRFHLTAEASRRGVVPYAELPFAGILAQSPDNVIMMNKLLCWRVGYFLTDGHVRL